MIASLYMWLKALHLIAMVAWMAGMLYLPRLFVYHTQVPVGSDQDRLFQLMERRLLRLIINPAMIAVFLLGGWLAYIRSPDIWQEGWWHAKLALVLLMAAVHGVLAKRRKDFAAGRNTKSTRYFRILNEIPTLLLILIILLAVLKPF